MLPDAEHLLSLEPEGLAGSLLLALEGSKEIKIEDLIDGKQLLHEIESRLDIKYPEGCLDDVLYALMEAWQWLEYEGFVARKPTNLVGDRNLWGWTHFVTRRGKNIETLENFNAYRKANLLPKGQLHSVIAQKVWSLFLQGDYDTAVFRAFKAVEIAVRTAGGYAETYIGVKLMRKAFNVETGNLTDKNQQISERQARSNLFAGAIGALKNPGSHRDVEITAEEAAELIIFASHLLRIVDSCN